MKRFARLAILAGAAMMIALASGGDLLAQTCISTTNNCDPNDTITSSVIQIGGPYSISSSMPGTPGRLDDGTIAGALYTYGFDQSTGILTLQVQNTTATTATLTGILFNVSPDVTNMILLSHTGVLPWALHFDRDRLDGVVDSTPQIPLLKAGGFGAYNVFLSNSGAATGPGGGNPDFEILAGDSLTFTIQVSGNLANITACSFTSFPSLIPPGDQIMIALGRFQSGEQGGSGWITPCGPGDLLVTMGRTQVIPEGGRVTILWETAAEIDNAGFAIIRRDLRGKSVERLNATLIPAQGSPFGGASYAFVDTTPLDGKVYKYQVEDWDLFSMNTLHPGKNAVPNPSNPPVRLVSPAYEAKAERSVTLKWEADGRRRFKVEISGDASFPEEGTMRIQAGARTSRTLSSREMKELRGMAAGNEGGVYWRVIGRNAHKSVVRSQTFFLLFD